MVAKPDTNKRMVFGDTPYIRRKRPVAFRDVRNLGRREYEIYIRNGEGGFRIGKRPSNAPSVCIYVPIQKRNEVGGGKDLHLRREKTSIMKFGHPEYIAQMPSQLRRYLSSAQRRPDMVNRLVHVSVGLTLLIIVYQAITRRHADIAECPCSELVNHEVGRDERQAKQKRRTAGPEPTLYYIGWADG